MNFSFEIYFQNFNIRKIFIRYIFKKILNPYYKKKIVIKKSFALKAYQQHQRPRTGQHQCSKIYHEIPMG